MRFRLRPPLPITAIILTYNEEPNLPACLASVTGWMQEVITVDSGSTDRTCEIAAQYDATIVEHRFETHAKQWTWTLQNLPLSTEWILGLDADQRVTPELRDELIALFKPGRADSELQGEKGNKEIRQKGTKGWAKNRNLFPYSLINSFPYQPFDRLRTSLIPLSRPDLPEASLSEVDGFYVKRRQMWRGRWIRHGTYYPKYLLKLFRRDKVQIDDRDLMDHHFWIAGNTAKLDGDIVEDNQKENDISFWIEKHNHYAALHAQEELLRRNGTAWPIQPALLGSPDQRVAWLKQRWYHLPLYVRPALYFIYRYFIRLGFLDGKEGFIFHFLQSFWYRLLVDIHLDELQGKKGIRE